MRERLIEAGWSLVHEEGAIDRLLGLMALREVLASPDGRTTLAVIAVVEEGVGLVYEGVGPADGGDLAAWLEGFVARRAARAAQREAMAAAVERARAAVLAPCASDPQAALAAELAAIVHGAIDLDAVDAVELGGVTLGRVARLDVLGSDGSMEALGFAIHGERDRHRTRQVYPSLLGPRIEDVGQAHEGGRATFAVAGLAPGRDALLVARWCLRDPLPRHELWAGDACVEVRAPLPRDPRSPWQHRPYRIPGARVGLAPLALAWRIADADALAHFRVWLFQPEADVALAPIPACLGG